MKPLKNNSSMQYRIKVLLTSTLGNPREITTICKSKSELARRKTMYEDRYPEADIFVEEIDGPEETAAINEKAPTE